MSKGRPNYYTILGVAKTADNAEIKAAYRKLSRIHHPDAGGDPEKFRAISEAYEVLSDSERRKRYDQGGSVIVFGASAACANAKLRFQRMVRSELRNLA